MDYQMDLQTKNKTPPLLSYADHKKGFLDWSIADVLMMFQVFPR